MVELRSRHQANLDKALSSTTTTTSSSNKTDGRRKRVLTLRNKATCESAHTQAGDRKELAKTPKDPCSDGSHAKPKTTERFDPADVFRYSRDVSGISFPLMRVWCLLHPCSRCLHRGTNLIAGSYLDVVWCEEQELGGSVTVSAIMQTLKDAGVLVVSGGSLSSRLRVQHALHAMRSSVYYQCICVV